MRITYDNALQCIQSNNAYIRSIASLYGEDKNWDFLLRQLADPNNVRPIATLDSMVDRTRVYNPLIKRWSSRQLSGPRGRAKTTPYIKKCSFTAVRPDGRASSFDPAWGTLYNGEKKYNSYTGILVDGRKCRLDDRYVFMANAATNHRWWLHKNSSKDMLQSSVGLAAMRSNLEQDQRDSIQPTLNEVLVRAQKGALRGIWAPKSDLVTRLNLQYRRKLIKDSLGVELPLLLISKDKNVTEYIKQCQALDIISASQDNGLAYHFYSDMGATVQEAIEYIEKFFYTNDRNSSWRKAIAAKPEVLCVAAKYSKYNFIADLLLEGADISYVGKQKKTALDWAVCISHIDIKAAEVLISHSNFMNYSDYYLGRVLFFLISQEHYGLAEKLIDKRNSVALNWSSAPCGKGLLHYAVKGKQENLLKKLLQHGANISWKNKDQETAVDWVCSNLCKNNKLASIIIKYANFEHYNVDKFCKHISSFVDNGDYKLAKRLIKRAVKIYDAKDFDKILFNLGSNKSLIHYASKEMFFYTIEKTPLNNNRKAAVLSISWAVSLYLEKCDDISQVKLVYDTIVNMFNENTEFSAVFRRQSMFKASFFRHQINGVNVSRSYSMLLKMIKNRALRISQDDEAPRVGRDVIINGLLGLNRSGYSVKVTRSQRIFRNMDPAKKDQEITREEESVLAWQRGLRQSA